MLTDLHEGSCELALAVGLNKFCKDRVRIVVVENHGVIGAAAGGVQEPTSMVAEDLAINGHSFGEHSMGLEVGISRDV